MKQTWQAVSIVIGVLVLATLACGGSNTGVKVDEVDTATKAPAEVETYGVGDVIEVKGQTIVLNSVELTGKILQANFTVENKGDDEFTVSTILSFSAKDDEGTKLEEDIFDCSPGLGGTILAGDKSKGNVCYETTGNAPYKIYYEATLFGSGAIVWLVNP